MLAVGAVLVAVANGLHYLHIGSTWLLASLLAVGGLAVVFGSCEAMINSVERLAERTKMNEFVAGTMAGLASNVPELVMLGFVLAAKPRVGFIVAMLTLHVGAVAFGIYSGLLPRDAEGHASLPAPLVKLSTDLYACAGAVFITTGMLMVMMHVFGAGDSGGKALGTTDLYVLGAALLLVEVIAVRRLVQRFSGDGAEQAATAPAEEQAADKHGDPPSKQELPALQSIVLYGLLGVVTSVIGGHAIGEFADILVISLTKAGYSEMIGALILSVFAATGALVMMATAHLKGMHEIALANVSGQINQVPFVVLPVALILLAVFGQTGVIEMRADGGILPIDLQTTSVVILAFPSMLILWKAVQDDGKINWVETTTMCAIFGLTIYFLAAHG